MDPIFYFDFISPYAYLAWKTLKKKNLLNKFILRPIVLGKIFSQIGQTPVTEVPFKRDYLYKRAKKFAALNNISLELPFQHPFNSLYLLRASATHLITEKNLRMNLIDKLWDYTWNLKVDVSNPEEIVKNLFQDGFKDAEKIIERTFEKDVKLEIKNNIKQALEDKVFGVPSFIVRNELFWGADTLPDFIEDMKNHE